jgi:hypothetical protein
LLRWLISPTCSTSGIPDILTAWPTLKLCKPSETNLQTWWRSVTRTRREEEWKAVGRTRKYGEHRSKGSAGEEATTAIYAHKMAYSVVIMLLYWLENGNVIPLNS